MRLRLAIIQLKSLKKVVIPTILLFFLAFAIIGFVSYNLFLKKDNLIVHDARNLYGDFAITSRITDWNHLTALAGWNQFYDPAAGSTTSFVKDFRFYSYDVFQRDLLLNLDGLENMKSFLEQQDYIERIIPRLSRTDNSVFTIDVGNAQSEIYFIAAYDFDMIYDFFPSNGLLQLPQRPKDKSNGVFLSSALVSNIEKQLGRPLVVGEYVRLKMYAYGGGSTTTPYLGRYENSHSALFGKEAYVPENQNLYSLIMDEYCMRNLMTFSFDAALLTPSDSLDDYPYENMKVPLSKMEKFSKTFSQICIKLKPGVDSSKAEKQIVNAMQEILPPKAGVERVLLDGRDFALSDKMNSIYSATNQKYAAFIAILVLSVVVLSMPSLYLIFNKQRTSLGLYNALGARPLKIFSFLLLENALLLVPAGMLGFFIGILANLERIKQAVFFPWFIADAFILGSALVTILVLVISFTMILFLAGKSISKIISSKETV